MTTTPLSSLEAAHLAARKALDEAVRDGWNVIVAVGMHPSGSGFTYSPINGAHDPLHMGRILEFLTPDGRRFVPDGNE